MHSWWWEPLEGVSAAGPWTGDWTQIAGQEEALLSESLAGWREKYPEVHVDQRSVRSDPVVELLEHARGARASGRRVTRTGRLRGLVLGSVSQRVLKRATCPVAVVHAGSRPGSAARAEPAPSTERPGTRASGTFVSIGAFLRGPQSGTRPQGRVDREAQAIPVRHASGRR